MPSFGGSISDRKGACLEGGKRDGAQIHVDSCVTAFVDAKTPPVGLGGKHG